MKDRIKIQSYFQNESHQIRKKNKIYLGVLKYDSISKFKRNQFAVCR